MLMRPQEGRMWTAEALHVSKPADFTGHMLTSPARPSNFSARPDPARWFFKIIEPGPFGPPGPCRALVRLNSYNTLQWVLCA